VRSITDCTKLKDSRTHDIVRGQYIGIQKALGHSSCLQDYENACAETARTPGDREAEHMRVFSEVIPLTRGHGEGAAALRVCYNDSIYTRPGIRNRSLLFFRLHSALTIKPSLQQAILCLHSAYIILFLCRFPPPSSHHLLNLSTPHPGASLLFCHPPAPFHPHPYCLHHRQDVHCRQRQQPCQPPGCLIGSASR
jgi:hypothetical protein